MTAMPGTRDLNDLESICQDLIELMPLATLAMDENGAILFANCRVTELLGWETDPLSGKKLTTLLPQRFHSACEKYFELCLRSPEQRMPLEGL